MHIQAFVNQKGGCGKTTTAIQVASRLAARGLRTILVDLDPQGHATLGLGVPPPEKGRAVADVLRRSGLDENAIPVERILVDAGGGLLLAPSGPELAELEPELARTPGGEERLAEHLAPLRRRFERVVVDAPPSLGLLTLNALTAAHEVIVPVEPSVYALHGLARLVELTRLLTGRTQHPMRLRILVNAYDGRSRFARETLEEIRRVFPDAVLHTVIRSSVRVREAAARGIPLDRHAPRSPISHDFDELLRELEPASVEERETRGPVVSPGLVVTRDGLYLTRHDRDPDQVLLAGDFNDWIPDSGVVLERHEDGGWTKFIPLPPGRHEYKLVVDGRWICDPLNPRRAPNAVGTSNSVVEIAT